MPKNEIRLTVEFAENDLLLFKWTDFAKTYVAPETYSKLDKDGGGRSNHWYIYRGKLPWARVTEAKKMFPRQKIPNVPPTVVELNESRRISQLAQQRMMEIFADQGIVEDPRLKFPNKRQGQRGGEPDQPPQI